MNINFKYCDRQINSHVVTFWRESELTELISQYELSNL